MRRPMSPILSYSLEEAFTLRFFCRQRGMLTYVPAIPEIIRIVDPLVTIDAPALTNDPSHSLVVQTGRGSGVRGTWVQRILKPEFRPLIEDASYLLHFPKDEWDRLIWSLYHAPCPTRAITPDELSMLVEHYSPMGMPLWASWIGLSEDLATPD